MWGILAQTIMVIPILETLHCTIYVYLGPFGIEARDEESPAAAFRTLRTFSVHLRPGFVALGPAANLGHEAL